MKRDTDHKYVLLMAGPTASGKSSLAVKLAHALNGVIINADSMQVYDGLRVLSARPSVDEKEGIPHRLFGAVEAGSPFSTADWHAMAMAEIETAWAEGRFPILVGGTGMYFKSLLDGLSPIPDVDGEVRAAVRAEMAERGPEVMHKELQIKDPAIAQRLEPGDSQRISRALEVVRSTGKPLSEWQKTNEPGGLAQADAEGRVLKCVLNLPREVLYERINTRFMHMVDEGALDEVKALVAKGIDPTLPVMKALGVPEFASYLAGECGLDAAIETAQMQTRRYAKRQTTWFTNQFGDWHRVGALDDSNAGDMIEWIKGQMNEGL